jgi:hypothetical protein
MKTREGKRMVKFYFIFILFQNYLFWAYIKKSAHALLGHGHSSWSTFGLHLVKGPKAL